MTQITKKTCYDPFDYPSDTDSDDWPDEYEQISTKQVATTTSSTLKVRGPTNGDLHEISFFRRSSLNFFGKH